jgi:HK97 family phage prohead protease
MEFKVIAAANQVNDRLVTGICSVFGNVDDGGDMVLKGAFTKTISERSSRVKHLWQHKSDEPPTAIIKGLREVGRDGLPDVILKQWPEATGGLEVAREYLDTPRADEILKGIQAGAITEMSFGFDVPKGKSSVQTVEGKSIRALHEIRLWECSDVQWGMNPATRAAKSDSEDDSEWAAFTLDAIARAVKDIGPDLQFKEGRVISTRNLEKLKSAIDALQQVLASAEPPAPEMAFAPTDSVKAILMRLEIANRELVETYGANSTGAGPRQQNQ